MNNVIRNALNLFFLLCALFISGCDRHEGAVTKKEVLSKLDVWVHTDRPEALALLQDQVARFNAAHNRIRVSLISVPRGTYHAQINAALRTGTLPDIIEIDGPMLYNFVERNALIKLDKILTETTRRDILPAVFEQGMYQGRVYSLATTSDSMVTYARRSAIESAGFQLPDVNGNWPVDEFERLLGAIKSGGEFAAAIDLGFGQNSERLTRVFSPLLLSGGGALIDERKPLELTGVLNSRSNGAVIRRVQEWIDHGYIDKNSDGIAFAQQRVALTIESLNKYQSYRAQFGADLVVLPLPDFGNGSVREQRGWGWGLTVSCEDKQAAMRFLEYLFLSDEVLHTAEANGLVPATFSALERSGGFSGTPPPSLQGLIAAYKAGAVVSQAKSPLYPEISKAFRKALILISNGADVNASLDQAASEVEVGRQKYQKMLIRLLRQEGK